MDSHEKAAYINSQTACALLEAAGMAAENQQRIHRGESLAYVEEQFSSLIAKYGIGHNAVVNFLS